MARVSLLMSCHGTGQWLPEALASIPWEMEPEVLVTANGAEDTRAVLLAAERWPIKRIYRAVTLPLSDSLNYMLVRATSPYIMRLDPDDKLPTGALAEMVEAAEATEPPILVYGGYVDFGAAARHVRAVDATLENLRARNPGGYNVLVDTTLARHVGGWREIGWEDWHFLARLVLVGANWVRLDRPTLLHRVRKDGRWADFYRTNTERIAAVREALRCA